MLGWLACGLEENRTPDVDGFGSLVELVDRVRFDWTTSIISSAELLKLVEGLKIFSTCFIERFD